MKIRSGFVSNSSSSSFITQEVEDEVSIKSFDFKNLKVFNSDGRSRCMKCNSLLVEVSGFSNVYKYCPICEP